MKKHFAVAAIACLMAAVASPDLASAQTKYNRPEVLNAIYSGNTASIMPRNDSEEKAMTGYIMGFLSQMGKSCSMHNKDQASLMAMLSIMGAMGGGLGFIASNTEGENDAKKLAAEQGCESKTTTTILRNINSFSWVR